MATIGPNDCKNTIVPLSWLVHVGRLKHKVNREDMADWCKELPNRYNTDWDYDKGGSWYFRYEEDAVAFFMVWG